MNKLLLGAIAGVVIAAPAIAQDGNATPVVQATPAVPIIVQQVPANANPVLPSNSDIWVSMDNEVSSKKVRVGHTIAMRVSRDVMVGQYVVIPRGTPASGHVSYRTGKGAFGKSAKFEFDIDSITLNGRTIPVSGHYRVEGQGNTGAAVGAVVAVGVFGAFVTGRSAVAAQGSEWRAATKEPLTVIVPKASVPLTAVAPPAVTAEAAAPAAPSTN